MVSRRMHNPHGRRRADGRKRTDDLMSIFSRCRSALLQRTDSIDDTHLLEILRTKDTQIVELECKARDHQKVIDLQENEIGKVKDEVATYRQLLEVRFYTLLE